MYEFSQIQFEEKLIFCFYYHCHLFWFCWVIASVFILGPNWAVVWPIIRKNRVEPTPMKITFCLFVVLALFELTSSRPMDSLTSHLIIWFIYLSYGSNFFLYKLSYRIIINEWRYSLHNLSLVTGDWGCVWLNFLRFFFFFF